MRSPTRRRLLLAVPAIVWAAVIVFVSTRPGSELPATGVPFGDKLLHFAEYALLGLLFSLPLRDLPRHAIVVLAVGAAFAGIDEAIQSMVPGRSADAWDFAVDVAGLLIAVTVDSVLRGRTPAAE